MSPQPLLIEHFHDTQLLRFPGFEAIPGFAHAITTRPWNMAPHRGPDAEKAVDRRRRICEHLGFDFDKLTAPDQIHSGHVVRIGLTDIGSGRMGRDSAVRFVDGLVSNLTGVPLLQLSADCLLIMVVDPVRRTIGTAHASWRGTVAHVGSNLIRAMTQSFGSKPRDLMAGLAPCASPPRYEVGEDVCRIAREMLSVGESILPTAPSGRRCFDLKTANARALVETGVSPDKIITAAECTMADDRFYSHRRDGESTGRFALFAGFR